MLLDRPDVRVGSEQDVLELAFLLVHLFDCLALAISWGWGYVSAVAGLEWAFLLDRHGCGVWIDGETEGSRERKWVGERGGLGI